MAVDQSSLDLRTELSSPTHLKRAQLRQALKAYRPQLSRIAQEFSEIQALLVDVEEDEANPDIQARLESLRQTCQAIHRQVAAAEKANATLAHTVRKFYQREAAALVDIITSNE